METAARVLIISGLALVAAGVTAYALSKVGLAKLPGDLVWRRGNLTLYLPIGTMLLLSILLTLLLNLLARR